MNIDGFRSVAQRPNAIVTVDLKSAQVRVRSNNVFNRAITWLRHRFSSAPSRTLATDAARNRFLQAIGDRRSGYDSADVSRARDLLAEDMENQRPLSTRRIREVLEDLDGRSSPTTRINRRVAVAYSDATGRPATLALRDLVVEAQKERGADTLSLYGDESVASAAPPESGMDGEDGLTRPGIPPSPDSYEPVAAGFASEPGTDGEDEMTQPLIPPSSTNATVRAAAPEAATATASAGVRTDQRQVGEAEVGATARHRTRPKDLARELDKAGFPREVSKYLKKQISSGRIVDTDGLVKHGNKRLAEWVEDNRVGKWYVEARKDKGVKRMAKREGIVTVPKSLCDDISRSITGSPALKHYPDVKVHARALVRAHVRREVGEEAV